MMGANGLRQRTAVAVFNANYMMMRLSKTYAVAFKAVNGLVADKFILDLKEFKSVGIATRRHRQAFDGLRFPWLDDVVAVARNR